MQDDCADCGMREAAHWRLVNATRATRFHKGTVLRQKGKKTCFILFVLLKKLP